MMSGFFCYIITQCVLCKVLSINDIDYLPASKLTQEDCINASKSIYYSARFTTVSLWNGAKSVAGSFHDGFLLA